ncbi:MAG TPA: ATP-binding protein [Vicinamibacterales bacterium]|nr:ATP-binding protein [Vicinamibacterales bacterium]
MSWWSDPPVPRAQSFARWAAVAVAALSVIVLIGWTIHVPLLESVVPGKTPMKPLTAASFLALAVALWFAPEGAAPSMPGRIATLAPMVSLAIGLVTLLEYSTGSARGIDLWLFGESLRRAGDSGRMAPETALGLATLGVALPLARGGWRAAATAHLLSAFVIALGTLGFAGYLYGAEELYRFAAYTSVSLPTAISLVMLGVAVMMLRPDGPALESLLSPHMGGVIARRLLPPVILLPFFFGWLRWRGEAANLYDTTFGLAIYACANVFVLVTLIAINARTVNALDEQRTAADLATRAAIAESERRYRQLAESLPQLIWTARADGVWDYLSPQWVRYTGLPAAAQLGSRWVAQLHPDDLPTVRAQWAWSIESGEPFDVECRIRQADGAWHWFRSLALPVRDESGAVVKWFGSSTDVDDRKRAEADLRTASAELDQRVHARTRELEAAKEAAESADRLKTEFIMSMSHELRTPLNAIIGFTGTMLMQLSGPLTEQQERHLKLVQASGRHLLAIISDVLDVARIEAGSLTLGREPVDVGDSVFRVCKELAVLAQEKGLRLDADVPPGAVVIDGDATALRQVLSNLVGNAIKFTPAGSVAVSVRSESGGRRPRVRITITDTGIGIDPADFPRLFTKFERLPNGRAVADGGTGLGLYLSRLLVEHLGGRIHVDSELGHGTRFTVLFDSSAADHM